MRIFVTRIGINVSISGIMDSFDGSKKCFLGLFQKFVALQKFLISGTIPEFIAYGYK